jgi:hypothetical protein
LPAIGCGLLYGGGISTTAAGGNILHSFGDAPICSEGAINPEDESKRTAACIGLGASILGGVATGIPAAAGFYFSGSTLAISSSNQRGYSEKSEPLANELQ